MNQKQGKILSRTLIGLGIFLLFFLEFILHRQIPYYNDDFWYSTNLVTGEPVSSLSDILQSQVWHYMNWGGRVINHGLLQAVLASGELGCDILNVLTTILLGIVICLFTGKRDPLFFLLAESLIIAFNPSLFYSMCWESGSVNYLYSSVWIFFYLYLVTRELSEQPRFRGIEIWVLPLALITGWSNENMGPASFVLTVSVMVYLKYKGRKNPIWLWEGACMTLLGSALVILAPGNFVRNQFIEKTTLTDYLHTHFLTILTTTFRTYLYPSFLIAVVVLATMVFVFRKKLTPTQLFLFCFAIVAQSGLFFSPTYPQRTSFGIMISLIAFITCVLSEICESGMEYRKPLILIIASSYTCAIYIVVREILLKPF